MPMHREIRTAILEGTISIKCKDVDLVDPRVGLQQANEIIASFLSDETVPFSFVDAGIGWDADDENFTYPEVTEAEIARADRLPLPHASMLIETRVDMPAGMPEIHCIWLITRVGACGYSAKLVVYRPADKALILHNTVFDFIPGRNGEGLADKMVFQMLNKQKDYYNMSEFEQHHDLLSRFLCVINQSKTFVHRVQADAALNKRRLARGRPQIRDYHVVRIGDGMQHYLSSLRRKHGTPLCEHRRRSHVRTYKSGKTTIVRNSIVNAGKGPNGPVSQTFMVDGAAD